MSLVKRCLGCFDDGEVIRWAFCGLLGGAVAVLGFDAWARYDARPMLDDRATATIYVEPALPPALRPGPSSAPREGDAPGHPLRFELRADGVMAAEGLIDPGSARRFALELRTHGGLVRTLSVNSPGGSVDDAIAMARLVRKRGIATEIAGGALCASSCPLLFAGGTVRTAGEKAVLGLHQFYAATGLVATNPAQAMSDTQATTARISRHLAEMGVDPALWLHALDTPPQTLYHLSREEMKKYRLVTGDGIVARGS